MGTLKSIFASFTLVAASIGGGKPDYTPWVNPADLHREATLLGGTTLQNLDPSRGDRSVSIHYPNGGSSHWLFPDSQSAQLFAAGVSARGVGLKIEQGRIV